MIHPEEAPNQSNNLPTKTILGNTEYFAIFTRCLPAQFAIFSSACVISRTLWRNNVYGCQATLAYAYIRLRGHSDNARRISETVSLLQHYQRPVRLLASPMKSLRKLLHETGTFSLLCRGRQRKKEFPHAVILSSRNWNPLTSIKGCPIASAFKYALPKIPTSCKWRVILMRLCSFWRDTSTYRNARDPRPTIVESLLPQKVGIWCALSYSPTVPDDWHTDVYLDTFHEFVNQLNDREFHSIVLNKMWVMDNKSNRTWAEIRSHFWDRIVSERLWVHMSRDMAPPVFFLWDLLNDRVFKNKLRVVDLKRNYVQMKLLVFLPLRRLQHSQTWSVVSATVSNFSSFCSTFIIIFTKVCTRQH
jgi:hypothetical protein